MGGGGWWGETRNQGETEKKKRETDRQREGLSLGLQTTVLFQSRSRVHRAGGRCVPLSQRVSSSSYNSMAACQSQMHDNKKLGLAI